MPIALLAGIVVVVVAAVGFITTRDTTSPDEPSLVVETRPVNDADDSQSIVTEANAITDTDTTTATEGMTEERVATSDGSTATAESEHQFANGTYTAQASYFTPRRTEHMMDVSLTVENDVVVATEILWNGAVEPKTPQHTAFENAYEAEVIGQPLSDISLSRVGGASLTTGAFNEAVATIEAEAAA